MGSETELRSPGPGPTSHPELWGFDSVNLCLLINIRISEVLPTFKSGWFFCGSCPMHCKIFSLISGLCPWDAICCFSVTKLCLILCDPMNGSMSGFPSLHYLPEFAQTHDNWFCDAIQPSPPLSSLSPPALNLSQHQSVFQCVSSSN